MNATEALEKTKALIEAGWTRGRWHRRQKGKDSYCLVGALYEAVYGVPGSRGLTTKDEYRQADDALCEAVRLRFPNDISMGPIKFNDTAKSKREVIALIDEALALLAAS